MLSDDANDCRRNRSVPRHPCPDAVDWDNQAGPRDALSPPWRRLCATHDRRSYSTMISANSRQPDTLLPDNRHDPLGVEDERLVGTLNHNARSHRADDLWRYIFAACFTERNNQRFQIGDFPTGLRPRHKNIDSALTNSTFVDRFSVQPKDAPSRTVVSHIRKDGHYYIHYDPTQCRSLTVREAARLQTFPDNYFLKAIEPTNTDR